MSSSFFTGRCEIRDGETVRTHDRIKMKPNNEENSGDLSFTSDVEIIRNYLRYENDRSNMIIKFNILAGYKKYNARNKQLHWYIRQFQYIHYFVHITASAELYLFKYLVIVRMLSTFYKNLLKLSLIRNVKFSSSRHFL